MIIDSKKYNGKCACGREHEMVTLLSVVESGCLNDIDKYLGEFGLDGVKVAVYDENTYKATEGKHPRVDLEVILNPENLHANEHGVALLNERLPEKSDVLIAVGSGTVHDITRYCAYTQANNRFSAKKHNKQYAKTDNLADTRSKPCATYTHIRNENEKRV